jgi:hypothetical protein
VRYLRIVVAEVTHPGKRRAEEMPETNKAPDTRGSAAGELEQIVVLLRGRGVRYPIPNRAVFVRQMRSVPESVTFRGVPYDADFAANLVPDFLFPIETEKDLERKVAELLVSRGLLPLETIRDLR